MPPALATQLHGLLRPLRQGSELLLALLIVEDDVVAVGEGHEAQQ